jgi:predicted nucleotidyltransferase
LTLPDIKYPNPAFKKVLTQVAEYFKTYPGVYAVVSTGSLARGKAAKESCIDLSVFLTKKSHDRLASTINSRAKAYSRLGGKICYFNGKIEGGITFGDIRVDVDFTDGNFAPTSNHSFDITRDEFETTIGNLLVYAKPLYQKGTRYQQLKNKHLPFYDEKLRTARLVGTAEEFSYKVWKARWLAKRGEFPAAMYALLEAHRIFLQHLFIKHRKYPIDYVKWLKEQCKEILHKPSLYNDLVSVIDGIELTAAGIKQQSSLLEKLFKQHEK